MKYFDKGKNCLAWVGIKSNSKFWDTLWNIKNLKQTVIEKKYDFIVLPTTKKFLPKGSSILEGGCGHGTFVYHLHKNGYKITGVDYAKKTIKIIKRHFPKLSVLHGDLRKLKFKNESFDGYWSLGVIEHAYEGYDQILSEMKRVLKKDGYLFITFPYMSPIRKLKALLNIYPIAKYESSGPLDFYQFALDHKKVVRKICREGFVLKKQMPFDGFRGIRSELSALDIIMKPIDKFSQKHFFALGIRFLIARLAQPFASHSILLVFKKLA